MYMSTSPLHVASSSQKQYIPYTIHNIPHNFIHSMSRHEEFRQSPFLSNSLYFFHGLLQLELGISRPQQKSPPFGIGQEQFWQGTAFRTRMDLYRRNAGIGIVPSQRHRWAIGTTGIVAQCNGVLANLNVRKGNRLFGSVIMRYSVVVVVVVVSG